MMYLKVLIIQEVKNSSDQAGWINTHKVSGRDNVYKEFQDILLSQII